MSFKKEDFLQKGGDFNEKNNIDSSGNCRLQRSDSKEKGGGEEGN